MWRTASIALASGLVCLANPALANVACVGTVNSTHVMSSGGVFVYGSWRSSYIQICNISTTWKGVPPEVCATWIAKADSAVSFGKIVTLYYSGTIDCSSYPTYGNAPAPVYVMIHK